MFGYSEYGMKLSKLTFETLKSIVEIYDHTVGGHGMYYMHPGEVDYVKKMMAMKGVVEWRFGSRLDGHSKLWIERADYLKDGDGIIYFRFSANFDPRLKTKKDDEKAEKLRKEFAQNIDRFLEENGLAVKLKK